MKRNFYIFCFTIFGLLVGLLVKGVVEFFYLRLLLSDFVTYSFGLSWQELSQYWFAVSALLLTVCGFWGFASGKFWWKQIYVLKRYRQKSR